MQRALVVAALATVFAATGSVAQAATKRVQASICAGSDCRNTGSQHNFNHPGWVRVPTGLPSGFVVKSLTFSCAAFCNNAALWPKILLNEGSNGTFVLLDAHHNGTIGSSSTARATMYTINIWIHY